MFQKCLVKVFYPLVVLMVFQNQTNLLFSHLIAVFVFLALWKKYLRELLQSTSDMYSDQKSSFGLAVRILEGTLHNWCYLLNSARRLIESDRNRFRSEKYCAEITLGIKKAFNSARSIMRALCNMATPPYIMEIKDDYFRNRRVWHRKEKGEREYTL